MKRPLVRLQEAAEVPPPAVPLQEALTPAERYQAMHAQIVALGARCPAIPWMSEEYMESPATSPTDYILQELHTAVCALGAVCTPPDEATVAAMQEAGRRHRAADQTALDAAHDRLVEAGARCLGTAREAAAVEAATPPGHAHMVLWEAAAPIREAVAASGVDAGRGLITFKMIQPGFNSSQTRYYSKEAVRQIADSMVGRKMFLNHPTDTEARERPERDLGTWVATIKESWVDQAGDAYGRASIVRPDFQALVTRLAETGQLEQLGASINALGYGQQATVEGVETFLVEGIDTTDLLRSVDWVTEPGAGGRAVLIEAATGPTPAAPPTPNEEQPDMAETQTPEVTALNERLARLEETLGRLAPVVEQTQTALTAANRARALDAQLAIVEANEATKAEVRAKLTAGTGEITAQAVQEAIAGEIAKAARILGREPGVYGLGASLQEAAEDTDPLALLQTEMEGMGYAAPVVEAVLRAR